MKAHRNATKIFCIGWHKTGTTTIGEALLILGYQVVGARLDLAAPLLKGNVELVIEEALKFESFQDVPWAALFKELDIAYPGSKFIFTVRDEKQWLNSASKHFGGKYYKIHEWLYGVGVLSGNEERYLARYREHNEEVLSYFKNRPNDLLIMSWDDGDSWKKLCAFLGKPLPRQSFPYANKGKHNYNWKDRVYQFIRSLIPMRLRKCRVFFLEKLGFHHGRNRFNNFEQNERELRSDREVSISEKD